MIASRGEFQNEVLCHFFCRLWITYVAFAPMNGAAWRS